MTLVRVVTAALLLLLLSFHYQLWLGKHSVFEVRTREAKLSMLERDNAQAQLRNQQMQAEIDDLRQGKRALEEKARYELGMIRSGEVFVQYVQ